MAKSRNQYIAENSDYNYDEDLIAFSLIDKATVTGLKKTVNETKDEDWNIKQLNSKLLQGILNGDPVQKIADSFLTVVGNNKASAERNARTMVTGAENKGRLDSYENLAGQGVVQKKVWIATPDDRTRESHFEIDGEEVDIDQAFSNGLMFPGDQSGDPSEWWNCRCSMRDHIVGFVKPDGSIKYVNGDRGDTLHSKQMQEEKERRETENKSSQEIIETKIIESGIIDERDNEIDISGQVYTRDEIMELLEEDPLSLPEILLEKYSEDELIPLMNEDGIFNKEKLNQFLFGKKEDKEADRFVPIVDNKPPTEKGLDLYASFINAGDKNPTYDSADIHTFAGYDPFTFGDYNSDKADLEKLKELDTVFTPASEDIVRYKGSMMTEEMINELDAQESLLHSYSSTTIDESVAKDYADRAYDSELDETVYPVYETLHIEKGVPIADAREILGDEGMRSWEKETTIGRETIWEYSNFVKHEDDGDIYYTVNVVIRRRK